MSDIEGDVKKETDEMNKGKQDIEDRKEQEKKEDEEKKK